MIRISDVSFHYGGEGAHGKVLEDFSLDIQEGKIHILIGPSGCGKTSLLYILAGLLKPTAGEIHFPLQGQRPRVPVGMVLQDYGLFPWKTVWKNIILGMEIRKYPAPEMQSRGEDILRKMGIYHLRNAYPRQLSGGEKQRAALARIWALEPGLLLMDEPFSALDALTREELQEWFLQLWEKERMTTLMVTHNIEEAVALGHRIIILSPSPGKVVKVMDNPLCHGKNAREHRDFYPLCAEIRSCLKEGRDSHETD